ncbi:MAG TPA: T9SS type A sorting domain-containing protein, partial [Patescibacteria group bacterium]|nr:T9SS type A sorting domain-containing protein [Patescibacteria group bacterium]
MKILFIILCAFLLKNVAEAQTWRKISPPEADTLINFQVIKDTAHKLHLFAFEQQNMYNLKSVATWNSSSVGRAGYGIGPGIKPGTDESFQLRYNFSSVIALENNEVQLALDIKGKAGKWTPDTQHPNWRLSLDTFKTFFPEPALSEPYKFAAYSRKNNSYYVLSEKLRVLDNALREIITSDYPVTENAYSYGIFPNFAVDERETGILYGIHEAEILKSSDNGISWSPIITIQDQVEPAYFSGVAFPPAKPNEMLIIADIGILRYNNASKTTDTVFRTPQNNFETNKFYFRRVVFKEDSDIAYAGTEKGEIYRSSDAGETWSLFASGFSTKPVIGIYASGNDSLIIGTEDGVWANYALPVSVAEEIPFKNTDLTITPNPANSSVKISFLKTELPQELSIYNPLGQLIFKTEFSGEFV